MNYNQKLCPRAEVVSSGKVRFDALTDAAAEIFASEANDPEQRRKKHGEQEKTNNDPGRSGDVGRCPTAI